MTKWRNLSDRLGNPFSPDRKRRSRKAAGLSPRVMRMEPFEERVMLAIGPQLVAVFPDSSETVGLAANQVLHVAPTQLIFRFDSPIDPTTLLAGGVQAIQVTRAGADHVLGTSDDVSVAAGFVGIGASSNEVVVRFANDLPNDLYQFSIASTLKGTNGLAFNAGQSVTQQFSLDLGAQVVAVVPQPVSRDASGRITQSLSEVDVYFNANDPLDMTTAQTKSFYELIRTNGTATTADDAIILPVSVSYNQTTGKAVLMFSSSALGVPGTYRLRIGNADPLSLAPTTITVAPGAAGSSFGTADNLQTLFTATSGTQSLTLSGAGANIGGSPVTVLYPGGDNEPGTRDINVEDHLDGSPDLSGQIPVYFYNFQSNIGTVNGLVQSNFITDVQKQRVREVLQYYANYLGVEFVETATSGFTIARGNPLVVDPNVNPLGIGGIAGGNEAVMNSAVDWGDSAAGGSFFQTAMHEIGHLLGLGHTYELPPLTIQGSAETGPNVSSAEPVFPGDADILLGQYLHPPVGNDINIYQFALNQSGLLNLETIAQRLGTLAGQAPSQLNTVITLFDSNGNIISRNDDYYGTDSLVSMQLGSGTYYVAVTSTGNTNYNPAIPNTGFGGTTQGSYQLRMTFTPTTTNGIKDTTGTLLDGDSDGTPGGNYNFWFNVASAGQTIFVDKITGVDLTASGAGSINAPYKTIAFALAHAAPGSIVRIEGNFGPTNNPATSIANWQSYNIGFDSLGNPLSDGSTFQIPAGVTVMVDAGAIIKLHGANIDVGSVTPGTASGGALQLLGTPVLPASSSSPPTGSVYLTSYYNSAFGTDPGTAKVPVKPGDWGGVVFHNDADNESNGIFLDYINHASISFGGGQVNVNSVLSVYDPIHLISSRPTITYNTITNSADAAVSADPNSFQESEFQSEVSGSAFQADYSRVGPQIRGNTLGVNTTTLTVPSAGGSAVVEGETFVVNGVTFKLTKTGVVGSQVINITNAMSATQVAAAIQASLLLNPVAGVLTQNVGTSVLLIGVNTFSQGASHGLVAVTSIQQNSINGLFVRIRTDLTTGQVLDPLTVSARFSTTDMVYVVEENLEIQGQPGGFDYVSSLTGQVTDPSDPNAVLTARPNARLSIDPGVVIKLGGARIETQIGSQLIAEGTASNPIVFTSVFDDRYGAAGSFDTTNDGATTTATAGNWGGLFFGPLSTGSVDHALITFGGGSTTIEGGFGTFDAVEIHQAKVRIANSVLENNAAGGDPTDRAGRSSATSAVIFVRGAQPVIVDNTIQNNDLAGANPNTAAISINVNSLNSQLVTDWGDSIGAINLQVVSLTNDGPLVRGNKLDNNPINGMLVRGGIITTDVVFDDTDIVQVVEDLITTSNQFSLTGTVRLQSSSTESLVVKLLGATAGFTASGVPLDITDRYGGAVQIIGTPNHPVVMTSLYDTTAGAGFTPSGQPQNDTANRKGATTPSATAGDWAGITLDTYSNDTNVDVVNEAEQGFVSGADTNNTPATAQFVGVLAKDSKSGDDNARLGFTIHGSISQTFSSPGRGDVDVYSFQGTAGTPIWIDMNQTASALDAVVELVDANGGVLARSDNAIAEQANPSLLVGIAQPLQAGFSGSAGPFTAPHFFSTNPLDPGMNVTLPGTTGSINTYYIRVRASNKSANMSDLGAGLTKGEYQLQIRLQDEYEYPGNVVRNSDIRFATNAIQVIGKPDHSPLEGDTAQTAANTFALTADPGGGAAVISGETFTINSSTTVGATSAGTTFTLTTDTSQTQTGFIQITTTMSATDVATAIQKAVAKTVAGVSATLSGTVVTFVGATNLTQSTPHSLIETEPNGSFDSAQDLGNLLQTSNSEISVAGSLSSPTQVAWFKFDLNYDLVQSIANSSDGLKTFAAMFAINYADGLTRPDTTLSIFDESGNLLLIGRDSQVPDAQPTPTLGADTSNTSHGSFGTLDPTIGSVQLPAGGPDPTDSPTGTRTYYVAVSSSYNLPTILDATFNATATNPLVRLEPVDSVSRIIDDHIGSTDSTSTAGTSQQAFPGTTPQQLNVSATPLTLGDVVMYVNDPTDLYTVNPFTGQLETWITAPGNTVQPTQYNTPSGASNPFLPLATSSGKEEYFDMAMRSDGRLMMFPQGFGSNDTPTTNSTYRQVNTTDGSIATTAEGGLGDQNSSPITTSVVQSSPVFTVSGTTAVFNFTATTKDPGVQFNAMSFGYDPFQGNPAANTAVGGTVGVLGRSLFAVGNRGDFVQGSPLPAGITQAQNLLFALDPNTGAPLHIESAISNDTQITTYQPFPNSPIGPGPGTSAVVQGALTTGVAIIATPATNPSNPDDDISNGRQFTIGNPAAFQFGPSDPLQPHINHPQGTTFQFDGGPTIDFPQTVDATGAVTYSPTPALNIVPGSDFFKIGSQVFRFETNGTPANPGEIAIQIHPLTDTPDILGQEIVNAVNSAGPSIGGTATPITGLTGVASYSAHRITFNTTQPVTLNSLANDGFSLESRPPVANGVIKIPFFAAESASQMATALRNAINGAGVPYPSGSGGVVRAVVNQGFSQDGNNTQATITVQLTGVLGSDLNLNSSVGEQTLEVTGIDHTNTSETSAVLNGQTFTITDSQRHTLTFQFGVASGTNISVPIPDPTISDSKDVALAMATAINLQTSANFQVTAVASGSNVILTGNLADYVSGANLLTTGGFPTNTTFDVLTTDSPVSNKFGQNFLSGTSVVNSGFGTGFFFSQREGDITGIAMVPTPDSPVFGKQEDRMFGVSDTGALYQITNFDGSDSAQMNLLNIVRDPSAGQQLSNDGSITDGTVHFTGLTAGPPDVENGLYKYTLFATDEQGNIWTFDVSADPTTGLTTATGGQLSHVLLDGATHILTPITDAQGITFSSLDYNLWHATTNRGGDPGPGGAPGTPAAAQFAANAGHGVAPSYDFNQARDFDSTTSDGGTSFYFGLENPTQAPGQPSAVNAYLPSAFDPSQSGNPALFNSYNLPGGAYGSLQAQPFSLAGYTAADKPTLYFNYALDTQDTNALSGAMRDSFRVYASTDGVNWEELVTNNSVLSSTGTSNAELPSYISASGGAYEGDKPNQQVQEAFDPTGTPPGTGNSAPDPTQALTQDQNSTAIGWRQARVDLGDFAGKSNVTLRFDFSSAGSMGVGANLEGGAYLGAVPGIQLVNNPSQSFVVDNAIQVATAADGFTPILQTTNFTFTFRSGFVLTAPVGGGAAITEGEKFIANGTTFTFTKTNAVGPTFIHINNSMSANDVAKAIQTTLLAPPFVLTAPADTSALPSGSAVQEGETFTVNGTTFQLTKTNTVVPGNVAINITNSMTAAQVATAINTVLVANTPGITTSPGGGLVVHEGETIKVNNTTFQLTRTGAVAPGNVAVLINNSMTAANVAGAIFNTISANPVAGVSPFWNGIDGNVQFVGATTVTLSSNPSLTTHGTLAGITPQLAGSAITLLGATSVTQSGIRSLFLAGVAGISPALSGASVQLNGATTVTQIAAPGQTAPAMELSGAALPASLASTDVLYNIDMSAGDVSIQIAKAMDATFAAANNTPANVNAANNTDDPTVFTSSKVIYTAAPDGNSQVPSGVLRIFGRDSANQYLAYLGHNVINPGPLSYSATLPGDNTGRLYSNVTRGGAFGDDVVQNTETEQRGQNNTHEGVYIDDIIVGFAGRGEMVTGLNNPVTDLLGGQVGVTGVTSFTTVPTDPDPRVAKHISTGVFQLDIRPATQYAVSGSAAFPFINLTTVYDINDRLTQAFTLVAISAAQITRMSTFQIATGVGTYTFQFAVNATDVATSTASGNYPILIHDGDSAATVALEIQTVINNVPKAKLFNVKAGVYTNGSRINLFGDDAAVNSGPLGLITFGGGPLGDTPIGGISGSFGGIGDATPVRPQGETIIQNNRISNSKSAGISVVPQLSLDPLGNPIGVGVPGNTGSVANLATLDTAQLVSGMSFSNNLIVNSGQYGILFSGAPLTDIAHAVPFGRIFNNTIVGAPLGIDVLNNASPTILNNIIAKALTAILVDATSSTTVVGESLYQNNGTNLSGVSETNPIFLSPGAPLFVDATKGNYYLAEGSAAIDSSVNTLPDRPQMVAVDAPLGIPASPIQAPNFDLLGQLRVDDPNVSSPPGLGSNIFKDRGAIERADFSGPTATLINPQDNDAAGVDRNPNVNQVLIVGKQLTNFSIQLSDTGVGVDDSTVNVGQFTITRNGVMLVAGTDYSLAYDTTNKIVQLIPPQGTWANGTYVIKLNNVNSASPIEDLAGNALQSNDATGVTQFVIQQTAVAAASWQNPVNKFDVNNDGFISGLDALLIIDSLITQGPRPLLGTPTVPPDFYYDVNGDGFLSPLDLLTITQYLNTFGVTPAGHVAGSAATTSQATIATPQVAVTATPQVAVTATPQVAVTATPQVAVTASVMATPTTSPMASAVSGSGAAVASSLAASGSPATTPLVTANAASVGTVSAASTSTSSSSSATAAIASTLSNDNWNDSQNDLESILTDLTASSEDPRLTNSIAT